MFKIFSLAIACCSIAQNAAAFEPKVWKVAQDELTSRKLSKSAGLFRVNLEGSDKVTIRYLVLPHAGFVYVCGNVLITGHTFRNAAKRMLRKDVGVYLDDKIIMRDVSFFNQVSSEEKLLSTKASCQSTDVVAPGGLDHTANFRLLKFRFRD